jgi:hypothetical protein
MTLQLSRTAVDMCAPQTLRNCAPYFRPRSPILLSPTNPRSMNSSVRLTKAENGGEILCADGAPGEGPHSDAERADCTEAIELGWCLGICVPGGCAWEGFPSGPGGSSMNSAHPAITNERLFPSIKGFSGLWTVEFLHHRRLQDDLGCLCIEDTLSRRGGALLVLVRP